MSAANPTKSENQEFHPAQPTCPSTSRLQVLQSGATNGTVFCRKCYLTCYMQPQGRAACRTLDMFATPRARLTACGPLHSQAVLTHPARQPLTARFNV